MSTRAGLSPAVRAAITKAAEENAAKAPKYTAEQLRRLRVLMGLNRLRDTRAGAA